MDVGRRGSGRRERVRLSSLAAGVFAATFVLATSAAMADTAAEDGDLVPVAAPASSTCVGVGCVDDGSQIQQQAMLLLSGTGSGCGDGGACLWRLQDYEGDKARIDDVPCCQWFQIVDFDRFRSAKNRYLARKVQTGNVDYQTSCMDPGENRPSLDPSDRFKVGVVGSSCG